jgi:methyltransferase (TIGR00027 family)
MREGKASRTAEFIALFRALETVRRPPARRLFHDPFARLFLGWPFRLVVTLARLPVVGGVISWFIDRRWSAALASAVSRTRCIDDALLAAVADGARQVVILGAGFDARALRLAGLAHLRVYEVDHPDTQRAKIARLTRARRSPPAHVCFVAADFASHDLAAAMTAGGCSASVKTFFLCEGVLSYLPAEAADALVRWVAAAAPSGSQFLFTYTDVGAPFTDRAARQARQLLSMLNRIGEDFQFGIARDQLPAYLRERGLALVSDVALGELNVRYFGPAAPKGSERSRLALARVA